VVGKGNDMALVALIILAIYLLVWVGYPMLCFCVGYVVWMFAEKKGVETFGQIVFASLTALFFLSIPFWDFLPTRHKLDKYMADYGGEKVFRVVSGVEGVHGLYDASKYGYCYGEIDNDSKDPNRKYARIYKYDNVENPNSPYKRQFSPIGSLYGVRESYQQVDDLIVKQVIETYVVKSGEVLGRNVVFFSYTQPYGKPGFSINKFRPWMKMNTELKKFENSEKELLLKTLNPAECTTTP
jgi:hypothetical protein